MEPRKLAVGFVFFPYSGSGAAPAEHPSIRNWFVRTALACKSDPRISDVYWEDFNDTPITMTRNASVEWARENKIDVLVMVDSDNIPDLYVNRDPTAKPFFQSSFDFLYAHYDKGPVMIGAPYCGHPLQPDGGGGENIFVFLWRSKGQFEHNNPTVLGTGVELAQFTREEAAIRSGIEEVAALPTGCLMADVRVYDLAGRPDIHEYEYKGDGPRCQHCGEPQHGKRTEKSSTEDVLMTRNISLNGCLKLGYNPVFCNWDAWAGHVKPQIVGKPMVVAADTIAKELGEAYQQGIYMNQRARWIGQHDRPGGPVVRAVNPGKTDQPKAPSLEELAAKVKPRNAETLNGDLIESR